VPTCSEEWAEGGGGCPGPGLIGFGLGTLIVVVITSSPWDDLGLEILVAFEAE